MGSTLSTAIKVAADARRESAAARREQMAQLRTTVRMHMGQNHDRRREVSDALVKLRQGWAEFRAQMRGKLRAVNAQVARRKARRV